VFEGLARDATGQSDAPEAKGRRHDPRERHPPGRRLHRARVGACAWEV